MRKFLILILLATTTFSIFAQAKIAYDYTTPPAYCSYRARMLCKLGLSSDSIPQSVDLGLSVKWADRNIGADCYYESGGLFAWGDKTGMFIPEKLFNKYAEFMPEEIAGDPLYDLATNIWGKDWRMPTRDECEELINKCTWIWDYRGNSWGYTIIGPNGNRIFLPASGHRKLYEVQFENTYGGYWCSEKYSSNLDEESYTLMFFDTGEKSAKSHGFSINGCAIRPVLMAGSKEE